jgi:hypothetical protein
LICHAGKRRAGLAPSCFVHLFVLVEPLEADLHAAGSQDNARVGRAVVQAKGIPIRSQGKTAGKNDVAHVPTLLVALFGPKDPFVIALETVLWLM